MKLRIAAIPLFIVLIYTVPSLQLAFATSDQNNMIQSSNAWKTTVNKQIQIVADVANTQDVKQPFIYIVQVKNQEDKPVSLTWIQGLLQPHQYMNPSQSWIPTKPGTYTAQIFVWQSLDNGLPLSEPLSMNIIVS